MKKFITIAFVALFSGTISAQTHIRDSVRVDMPDTVSSVLPLKDSSFTITRDFEYSDEFLDTVKIRKKLIINDYSMIGVQYGVALSQVMFNPTKKQGMLMNPVNVGVIYTRYGKMFGYMPYFGFQTGIFYGQNGYKFKIDKETGDYSENVDGATQARYTFIEVPLLAHMHMDVWHLKFIVNAGLFGGYRMSVQREGKIEDKYRTEFYDYDKRFEYGIKAGVGFGFFFDPVELHFQATYRYTLGSLYKPDYKSEYYYRFAYPSDIIISAGLHFQLTRRTGKTRKMLKNEAKGLIYETRNEDIDSNSR